MFYLNSHRKKNFLIIIISVLLSSLFFYLLFFAKTYFSYHEKAPNVFHDLENFRFHKKYSKIIHHLRGGEKWGIKGKPENYNGWNEKEILSQLSDLNKIGIDLNQITENLQTKGVQLFADSFDNLINSIESKINNIQTQAI